LKIQEGEEEHETSERERERERERGEEERKGKMADGGGHTRRWIDGFNWTALILTKKPDSTIQTDEQHVE
jgi:hypothetical protein